MRCGVTGGAILHLQPIQKGGHGKAAQHELIIPRAYAAPTQVRRNARRVSDGLIKAEHTAHIHFIARNHCYRLRCFNKRCVGFGSGRRHGGRPARAHLHPFNMHGGCWRLVGGLALFCCRCPNLLRLPGCGCPGCCKNLTAYEKCKGKRTKNNLVAVHTRFYPVVPADLRLGQLPTLRIICKIKWRSDFCGFLPL